MGSTMLQVYRISRNDLALDGVWILDVHNKGVIQTLCTE